MSGKFVGLFSAVVVAAGLVCAGSAGADPDEAQQIRWSEQSYLLDGSYARAPRQVWSVSLGDDGLSLHSSSFERDGDVGYFQLSPTVDTSGEPQPGVLVAIDLGSGATVFQHTIPAGAYCSVDQDDHVVHCGGSGSQESAQQLVMDSRSGEALIDQSPPGDVLASGAEHGVAYAVTKTDDPKGNVALAWQPVRGEGPSGKAVLRLKRKPAPLLGSMQQIGQMVGLASGRDGAAWDGWISTLVSNNEFETAEIMFRPGTGEARVKDQLEDRSQAFEWLVPRPSVQTGEEQLSVRIHGDTVYDRASGTALWSNPALVTEQMVSDRDGRGSHRERSSAVEAVVHDNLVVNHLGNHGESPAFQVFDLRTGHLRWESPDDLFTLFFLTDGRYAVDTDHQVGGNIVATDLATGEQAWRIKPPGGAWSVTKLDGDMLVAGAATITRYTAA